MPGGGFKLGFDSRRIASATLTLHNGCAMRHFILSICSVAAAAVMPAPVGAQTWPYALQLPNKPTSYPQGRAEPPTETSIPIVGQQATVNSAVVTPQRAAPKPVVRHKIVRRKGDGPTGPMAMPPPDKLVMMVRSTLAGVNQANFTENYTVLHGMATPTLQARVTAAQFGKAFDSLRKQNLDLSPILVLPPEFTVAPALTPQGVLRLTGIFPSRPLEINFAIDYLPVDGAWMIDALSVSALPAGAPAPVASSAPVVNSAPVANSATSAPTARAETIQNAQPTLRFVPTNSRVEAPLAFASADQSGSNLRQAQTSHNRNTAVGGPYVPAVYVQVAAKRNEAEAQTALRSMQATFPEIFVNRQTIVKRADLAGKGVYYRAQIGPFSAEQARRECDNLKAAGGQCFVQNN